MFTAKEPPLSQKPPDLPEACRSEDQPVLISGSMGIGSWVLVGTDKAMELNFRSTSHGAG